MQSIYKIQNPKTNQIYTNLDDTANDFKTLNQNKKAQRQ